MDPNPAPTGNRPSVRTLMQYLAVSLILLSAALVGFYTSDTGADVSVGVDYASQQQGQRETEAIVPRLPRPIVAADFESSGSQLVWDPNSGISHPSQSLVTKPTKQRVWSGKTPPITRKNYVLTLASGYSVQDLSPFFRSWALRSPETRIIVFTDEAKLTPQHRRLFRESRIYKLIDTPLMEGWVPHTMRIMAWAEWFRQRVAEEDASGIPDDESEYGFILNADVRDTIVQRDPWQQPVLRWIQERRERYNDQYVVFAPEWGVEIATEPTGGNRAWIQECFGDEALEEIGEKPVSCSGVTMGTFRGMAQYWAEMWEMMREGGLAHKCHGRVAADQGLHNYLLHHTLALNTSLLAPTPTGPHLPLQYVVPTFFDSPVYTAHYSPPLGVNTRGEVIRPRRAEISSERAGTVIELIHQYDRHGEVNKGVRKWLRIGGGEKGGGH